MGSVTAYLDDFDLMHIEIARFFYGGECSRFFVSYFDGRVEELQITDKTYYDDKVVYAVKMFKHFEFGQYYEILDEHGYRCEMVYRYILRTKRFNDEYYYEGNDLGANYTREKTVFKLWAPTAQQVFVELFDKNNVNQYTLYPMERGEKGVFKAEINADLDGVAYLYLVRRNEESITTIDPYAKGSSLNARLSVVINPAKTKVEKVACIKHEIPVIYEASIRDFTSKLKNCHRATFKGFTSEHLRTKEDHKAGFDYLKALGITHVQLMPIYDFYTVEEDNKWLIYNWGYDPIQYNVPEGSFASNPLDPYSRIIDLKEMVQKLHKHQLEVVMDVVYNHMYDRGKSAFERVLPYYYFRMNNEGYYSNGSGCGNDVDSLMPMCRKYIVDSISYWMDEYDIDGFRFDLMGILDLETMKEIEKAVHARKPQALLYGEGWNMPTMMADEDRAHMYNAAKIPEYGFFNDMFRDVLKGKSDEHDSQMKGYLTGNLSLIEDAKRALCGYNYTNSFTSPMQSINYVECHDNATAYDKIQMCCWGEGELNFRKRVKLLLGAVMTAQGIPFIHCGQEFCRSKGLRHNTYNTVDEINGIDFDRKDEYIEIVRFFKELIKLRSNYPVFNYQTYEAIDAHVSFENLANGALKYTLKDGKCHLDIYFNPTFNELAVDFKKVVLSSSEENDKLMPLSFVIDEVKN